MKNIKTLQSTFTYFLALSFSNCPRFPLPPPHTSCTRKHTKSYWGFANLTIIMLRFKINFIIGNMKETLRCVSSGAVLLVDGEAQERGLRDSEIWAWPASNQQVFVAASPALPVTPRPDLTAAWLGRNSFCFWGILTPHLAKVYRWGSLGLESKSSKFPSSVHTSVEASIRTRSLCCCAASRVCLKFLTGRKAFGGLFGITSWGCSAVPSPLGWDSLCPWHNRKVHRVRVTAGDRKHHPVHFPAEHCSPTQSLFSWTPSSL